MCGIINSKIQQKLLAKKPETLKRAVAQGMEAALKNAKELAQKEGSSTMTTNRVTLPTRGKDADIVLESLVVVVIVVVEQDTSVNSVAIKRQSVMVVERLYEHVETHHPVSVETNNRHERDPYITSKEVPRMIPMTTLLCTQLTPPPSLVPSYIVAIEINGKALPMEIDTGASLMLVSEGTFKESWPTTKLTHTGIKLHSYSGESVPVVGTADVTVKYGDQVLTLPYSY